MTDVLVLVAGEFDQQTDPSQWWRITTGEVVPETTSANPGLQLSAGERVTVTGPTLITVDCAELRVCNVGVTGGACDTETDCADNGEKHRVEWDTTGCVNASHHIRIRQSKNGGGFNEVADDLACDPGDPDVGCCRIIGGTCVPDGQYIETLLFENTATPEDYQYQIRIELDGGDVLAQPGSFGNTNTETDKGGDTSCS